MSQSLNRHEKSKSGSIFDILRGTTKRERTGAISSTNLTRPFSSETDIPGQFDVDQMVNRMSDYELNKKFEEMLNELNLTDDGKTPLRSEPIMKKRQLLILHLKTENRGSKFNEPHDYIQYLQNLHELSINKLLNCMESLRIDLTNRGLRWLEQFGDLRGLKQLLNVLKICYEDDRDTRYERVQSKCLCCLSAFMNNTKGLKQVIDDEHALVLVARCLQPNRPTVMCEALKLLAVTCFVRDHDANKSPDVYGHKRTLDAITIAAEQTNQERFKPIVKAILDNNNEVLWNLCLQFINAIITQIDDFEYRLHLRNEIMRAGFIDVIDFLREKNSVEVQVQVFDNLCEEDADQLHARFDTIRLDVNNVDDCYTIAKNLVSNTVAEPYLLSIMQHLLLIRDDHFVRPAYYKLIEECVSQIVLHRTGLDPDFRATKRFQIDVQPLIDNVVEKSKATDEKTKAEYDKQLEELMIQKQEALAKLARAEEKLKEKGLLSPQTTPPSLPILNLPMRTPHPINSLAASSGPPPPPPPPPLPSSQQRTDGNSKGSAIPPPPPPPMIGGGPPPPPPPLMPQLPRGLKPKKTWTVNETLKKANWKPIVPFKLSEKSFWVKCNEEKLASSDILNGLIQKFNSKPIKSDNMSTSNTDTLSLTSRPDSIVESYVVKQLKILDQKSAQNISIILGGSLKHYAYSDIKLELWKCTGTILRENVLEQLLQYLPPMDQLNRFSQLKDQYGQLTEAEQFCVTISDIKRLQPRLESLRFRAKFAEIVNDIKPAIVAATTACEQVRDSKKFAKILELILLFGNYMNASGKREQAFGFEISFLTKLTSTKDNQNKGTLLHFLVDIVERKFPDLLGLPNEISHVDKACRVSLDTIQKTLNQMKMHLKNLETDLVTCKVPQCPEDQFYQVMTPFLIDAREQHGVLQSMFENTVSIYQELADYFVFDKSKYVFEDFFNDIKTFKDSFLQVLKDIETERENEEKRIRVQLARQKAESDKREREARNKALIKMDPSKTEEGVMDSLLKALNSGDAFRGEPRRKRVAAGDRKTHVTRSRSRPHLSNRDVR